MHKLLHLYVHKNWIIKSIIENPTRNYKQFHYNMFFLH